MAKKNVDGTTLLITTDEDNNEVFLFYFIAPIFMDMERVRTALAAAFLEWNETPKGKATIESNGGQMNWGDACEIPDAIILKHGIKKYDTLYHCIKGKNVFNIAGYDIQEIVEHNEILFDQDDQN